MTTLTFKDYLSIMSEDTQMDISKLQSDIAMLDTQINSRIQPLVARKTQLQKQLLQKEKQSQAEAQKAGNKPQQNPMQANQQQQQMQGVPNRPTTPGSTGGGQPGSGTAQPMMR